jgi:hypothetical protein
VANLLLVGLLAVAGLAAATLLGLALAGFARRRSRPYLLVALALATLLARVGVASAAMAGLLVDADHHLAEHVLDVLMAALVIGAVYTARSARRRAGDPYDVPGEVEGRAREREPAAPADEEVVDDD